MTNGIPSGPAALARRDLHREQMKEYGGDLEWLSDPSLIPVAVTSYGADFGSDDPYINARTWMLERIASWSADSHLKLSYQETFDKHDLDGPDRVGVRSMLRDHIIDAHAPGFDATGEILQVVPEVAIAAGITDPAEWTKIASKSREFGAAIAKNGTAVQSLIRLYIAGVVDPYGPPKPMQPELFRLDDDTGITTVKPIDEIIEITKDIMTTYSHGRISNVCVALQAPVKGIEGNPTMYDAAWDAFVYVADKWIYPMETPGRFKRRNSDVGEDVHEAMYLLIRALQAGEKQQHEISPMDVASLEQLFKALGVGVSEVTRIDL